MGEIDYKQIAKNVLVLVEKSASKKLIENYVHYILYPDDIKYNKKNYISIWKAMDIIDEN